MEELNIGHTIISRAALVGLERAVREMKQARCEESFEFWLLDEDANLLLRASQRFLLEEEPEESSERTRHYHEKGKEIDFWWVLQPGIHLRWQSLKLNAPAICCCYFHQSGIYYLAKTAIRVM